MTNQEVLWMDNAAWGISELADGTIVEADTGALLIDPPIANSTVVLLQQTVEFC